MRNDFCRVLKEYGIPNDIIYGVTEDMDHYSSPEDDDFSSEGSYVLRLWGIEDDDPFAA